MPCSMTRLIAAGLANGGSATRWTTVSAPSAARRRLSASVMSPWTSSQPQARKRSCFSGLPREHADRHVLGAERVDDVAAHEPGAPDDEDGHSKFFQ